MPAGQGGDDGHGRDEESFASAVERGCPPGRAGDLALSHDLAIVALLRAGGETCGPTPEERGRSRTAVLARLTAADDPFDHPAVFEPTRRLRRSPSPGPPPSGKAAPDREAPLPSRTAVLPAAEHDPVDEPAIDSTDDFGDDELAAVRQRRRSGRRSRPADRRDRGGWQPAAWATHSPFGKQIALVAAAVVTAAAVLGGTGVLASNDTLPGDSLYPLKRVAESASLAMIWDDIARGYRHLDLASTRIDEVERLLAENPEAGVDPAVISAALRDFDAEVSEASRLLLAAADAPREQILDELLGWGAAQADRLATLRRSLPDPAMSGVGGSLQRREEPVGPDAVDAADPCADTPETPAACAPATDAPAGTLPDADPVGDPTGSATGSAGPSGSADRKPSDPRQSGDSEPWLLPQLVSEPVDDELSPGEKPPTPTTAPAESPDEDGSAESGSAESGSGEDGSGEDGSGEDPGLEVPPLLPGLPGVSVG